MAKNEVDDAMFQRTLLKYVQHTKRSIREILNVKAYWVARNAIKFTRAADKAEINAFAKNWKRSAPVIIKMFGLKNNEDWNPKTYQKKLAANRRRGIGYLRSGWIPTLKKTGGWAKQSRSYKGVRHKGRRKGFCKLAKSNWSSATQIVSLVGYKKTKHGRSKSQVEAAKAYVKPALRKAITKEAQSMGTYIRRKMAEAKRKAGIK